MNLQKRILGALAPKVSDGLFIKLRHAFPNVGRTIRSFRRILAPDISHNLNERIVVVGIGTAALSCLRTLQQEGFKNVTCLGRDALFGGKCVNIGCMPVEYCLSRGDLEPEARRDAVKNFVQELRSDVEKQFVATGYSLATGTAIKVEGKCLHLADGRSLEFDRLIVAIGNDYPKPPEWADISNAVAIEDFWGLPTGGRLTILADGNITALTLAEVAQGLGLRPTVILSRRNPMAATPSFRYFVRGLASGIKVHENANVRRVTSNLTVIDVKGKATTIAHDHVLSCGRPEPKFIEVDGVLPTVFDLDLVRGCLPTRPDVIFLGDGGGLLTSSEADIHAQLMIRAWKYGQNLDFKLVDSMPVRIHARRSLAMVGPIWTYAEKKWEEVDFRSLAWSRINGFDGKLWFLLDQGSGMVTAVHICHPNAGELIGIAAALMRLPVRDPRWLVGSVHPSGAEVFKIVAERAVRLLPDQGESRFLADQTDWQFALPPIDQLDGNAKLPDWLDRDGWFHAMLSNDPYLRLAIFFGLTQLGKLSSRTYSTRLVQTSENRYQTRDDDPVLIENDADDGVCRLRHGERRVHVRYQNASSGIV